MAIPLTKYEMETLLRIKHDLREDVTLNELAAWWLATKKHRKLVHEALLNWHQAGTLADQMEGEMHAFNRDGKPHPGWSLLQASNALLTHLGEQCMTEDQAKVVQELTDEWKLVEHKPREFDA